MVSREISDLVATVSYLTLFITCLTWAAIAIGHTSAGRVCCRWLLLVVAMVGASAALLIMALHAGWNLYEYGNILLWSRAAWLVAALFAPAFTVTYLLNLWRKKIPHQ